MSRSGGYKCYNMSCNSCIGRTICGEPGDGALNCDNRIVTNRTNADLIRRMSSEELADQLVIKIDGLAKCSLYLSAPIGRMFISRKDASRETLEWLRHPAEED